MTENPWNDYSAWRVSLTDPEACTPESMAEDSVKLFNYAEIMELLSMLPARQQKIIHQRTRHNMPWDEIGALNATDKSHAHRSFKRACRMIEYLHGLKEQKERYQSVIPLLTKQDQLEANRWATSPLRQIGKQCGKSSATMSNRFSKLCERIRTIDPIAVNYLQSIVRLRVSYDFAEKNKTRGSV